MKKTITGRVQIVGFSTPSGGTPGLLIELWDKQGCILFVKAELTDKNAALALFHNRLVPCEIEFIAAQSLEEVPK